MTSILVEAQSTLASAAADRALHAGQRELSGQVATVIAQPISGDYRIDVLLDQPDSRWNRDLPVGSAVEVTYSFATLAPSYGGADDRRGWSAFTAEQVTATRDVLGRLSQVSNISFREVADSGTAFGTIRFHNNEQGPGSAGYAYSPDQGTALAGDSFINNTMAANLTGLTRGTEAYATLVHEVLHAIGLKHPGNYNAGEPPSDHPGNFLIQTEDNYSNTILSYVVFGTQSLERDFLGPYDLLALQYLYGAKSVNPEDTVVALGDAAGRALSMIIDSAGRDTLDTSGSTVAASINLIEGASSSIGTTAANAAAVSNIQIAFGSVIEDAVGTSLADTLIGNAVANIMRGQDGNDSLFGNAGNDQLFGGDGVDIIYGGDGDDYMQGDGGAFATLVGGPGNDTAYGGAGNDYIVGDDGNDVLVGLGGLDSLFGGPGNDYIVAGDGPGSVVDGGAGANTLWGAGGADYLVGGELADLMVGGDSSDFLFGNAGNDTLYGGRGTDYLSTNAGNDFVWTDDVGAPQSQDFVYAGGGTGIDTIADFTVGAGGDVVVVAAAATGIGSFAQLQAVTSQAGIYTVLTLGADEVYLYNVSTSHLTASNFLFL